MSLRRLALLCSAIHSVPRSFGTYLWTASCTVPAQTASAWYPSFSLTFPPARVPLPPVSHTASRMACSKHKLDGRSPLEQPSSSFPLPFGWTRQLPDSKSLCRPFVVPPWPCPPPSLSLHLSSTQSFSILSKRSSFTFWVSRLFCLKYLSSAYPLLATKPSGRSF